MANETEIKEFASRAYQDEIATRALKENIICVLGTGTGKTYIAVKVIRELSHQIDGHWDKGSKRTVFIVPSVPLVVQQARVLHDMTGIPTGEYSGIQSVDNWTPENWHIEFRKNQILVMVHDIFKDLLQQEILCHDRINLLVVDECHHATKNHPFREIMRTLHLHPNNNKPRILGLTASVINVKLAKTIKDPTARNTKVLEDLEKEFKTLESCMNATVVTSYDPSLSYFGARPDPITEKYILPPLTEDMKDISKCVGNFIEWLACAVEAVNGPYAESNDLTERTKKKHIATELKEIKNAFGQVENTLRTVGGWAAYRTSQMLMKDLVFMKSLPGVWSTESLTPVNAAIANLQLFGTMLENIFKVDTVDVPGILANRALMSEKICKLLQILCASAAEADLCCIVFVTERYNCWALHMLLKKLSSHKQFAFIRSGFCVGGLEENGCAEPQFEKIQNSSRQFISTINKFHRGEINVLVATSILEEGFDVPECNLIIRFDPPSNFRSYVQSKGRARAKNSKYIMMVNEDKSECFGSDLAQFQQIDADLSKFCVSRNQPTEQEQDEHFADNICEPVRSAFSNAIITANGALACLWRYCSTLPNNSSCRIYPENIRHGERQHQCKIYLPLSAAIKEFITGPVMEDPLLAKKAAALKVCQMLLDIGELDPINLLPKSKDSWMEDIDDYIGGHNREIATKGLPGPGTRKRIQSYRKQIPEPFRFTPTVILKPFFLYLVQCTPVRNRVNPLGKDSVTGPISIGLLCTQEIPQLPAFPLYFLTEEVLVELMFHSTLSLSHEELLLVQHGHHTIFASVIGINQSMVLKFQPMDSSTENILYVPLKTSTFSVDWATIQKLIVPDGFMQENFSALQNRSPNAASLKDAVVACWYRGEEERFLVSAVREDLRPASMIANNTSPAQIVKEKYGIDVRYPQQPLIEVRNCSKALNFLTPKPLEMKSDERSNTISVIPELFKVLPITQQFLVQCRLLPSITHRIRQFCATIQLYKQLKLETNIGADVPTPQKWKNLIFDIRLLKTETQLTVEDLEPAQISAPELDEMIMDSDSSDENPRLFYKDYEQEKFYKNKLKKTDMQARSNYLSCLIPTVPKQVSTPVCDVPIGCSDHLLALPFNQSFDQEFLRDSAQVSFPEVTSLLNALTTANAGDFFNLERLETIGDSFLKMITCIYLYLEYPKYHEGRLEFLKSHQVSNYNLYRLGKEKKIVDFVYNQFFEPKINFLPPGFTIIPNPQGPLPAQLFQNLADKSLADVMEALIGLILVECGCGPAQKYMNWLGLRVMAGNTAQDQKSSRIKNQTLPSPGFTAESSSATKWVIGCCIPQCVSSPLLRTRSDPLFLSTWEHLISNLLVFQDKIGYRFQEQAFLVQAFTHSSYIENRITDCYQRLEFLGDAILDFLVTRYLYENDRCLAPGKLTDLRSALVNNKTFAMLAIKNNYHNHIKISNPQIFGLIKKYVSEQRKTNSKILPVCSSDMLDLDDGSDDDDDNDDDDDEVVAPAGYEMAEDPKILGDVFESVAGAIFLDSGLSLDAVWKVYYNIMKETIDFCVANCPKNPVRLLMEAEPSQCFFWEAEVLHNRKVQVKVEVVGKGQFFGLGNNKRAAKCNAARKALIELRHAEPKDMF